jgi:LPXTG-motif cell wall-anchored protein
MRFVAVVISAGVLAASMALPALLFAQEPPAADAPPAAAEPAAEAPPGEPEPGAGGEQPPADPQPAAVTGTSTVPSASPAPAVAKGSASVSIVDFAFSPASVTIGVGGSVTWTNTGEEDHDATPTGGGFSSTGNLEPGASATRTFSSAGTFSYICTIHPDMKGTVVVGSGGSDPSGTAGTGTDTGAPLGSEAAAGAQPGAAGSASGLPATGQSEPPLLVIGLGLIGCGAAAALLARWREREELF